MICWALYKLIYPESVVPHFDECELRKIYVKMDNLAQKLHGAGQFGKPRW